jgi:PHD/YefM family antitoxin component YafN of YafNO toxin-antitoxin module
MFRRFLLVLFSLRALSAFAQDSALKETQDLLRDPNAVAAYAKDNPQAAAALQGAQYLTRNPETQASLMDLAAEAFETIMVENNNNPEAVQQALAEYKKNPAALLEKMPEAQRAKVRAIANKIDPNAGSSPIKP